MSNSGVHGGANGPAVIFGKKNLDYQSASAAHGGDMARLGDTGDVITQSGDDSTESYLQRRSDDIDEYFSYDALNLPMEFVTYSFDNKGDMSIDDLKKAVLDDIDFEYDDGAGEEISIEESLENLEARATFMFFTGDEMIDWIQSRKIEEVTGQWNSSDVNVCLSVDVTDITGDNPNPEITDLIDKFMKNNSCVNDEEIEELTSAYIDDKMWSVDTDTHTDEAIERAYQRAGIDIYDEENEELLDASRGIVEDAYSNGEFAAWVSSRLDDYGGEYDYERDFDAAYQDWLQQEVMPRLSIS